MARPILTLGLSEAGLEEADRSRLTKGDWRKRVIGRAIRKQTTVSAGWIARKLKSLRPAAVTGDGGRAVRGPRPS